MAERYGGIFFDKDNNSVGGVFDRKARSPLKYLEMAEDEFDLKDGSTGFVQSFDTGKKQWYKLNGNDWITWEGPQ